MYDNYSKKKGANMKFTIIFLKIGYFWPRLSTMCPRSSDPFYVVTYYMKLVTTSWTYCKSI